MSKIYIPHGRGLAELCQPDDAADYDLIKRLVSGFTRREKSADVRMNLIREDERGKLVYSSSPWLGSHALIFRPECFDVIGSYLKHGELLPIICPGAELYFFNPVLLLNALDVQASKIKRFKSGDILKIENYVFNEALVKDAHIFKINDLRVCPTFVSEAFVECWRESKLVGLDFKLIWDKSD